MLGRGLRMAVLLLGVTVLVLAGCSADTSITSAPPTAPPETTAVGGETGTSAAGSTSTTVGGTATIPTTGTTESGLGPGSGVETEAKRLSPESGPFAICQDCHTYLDPPRRPRAALNDAFRHEKHLARSAACGSCHESPVHTESTVRRPTMSICYQCHGSGPDSSAPDECSLCHPPDFEELPASHDGDFYAGSHARAVAAGGPEECFVCHQEGDTGFCRACHGLELPHPPGWALDLSGGPGAHVDAAHENAAVCVRCHENRGRAPAGCYGGECHGA